MRIAEAGLAAQEQININIAQPAPLEVQDSGGWLETILNFLQTQNPYVVVTAIVAITIVVILGIKARKK